MKFRSSDQDTIVALSTPPGEGGLGVVRLSGKKAVEIADKIFTAASGLKVCGQKSYTASYGRVVFGGKTVDEALLLLMRSPKSYTREDVVEISSHGSAAVLGAVIQAVLRAGARMAEPGEFTKRAFLNGRIDLLQAEAVLDLIRAKTDLARRWSLSQLEGHLSKKIILAKNKLVEILSHLEAAIDFPEEELGAHPLEGIRLKLSALAQEMRGLLASSDMGEIARRGLKAVITGKPNVGKSSLMNRLVGRDRVIVTPFPGTTRDVVEVEIQVGGFPVRLFDTAGIHETEHPIEKEGIEMSRKAHLAADLVIAVFDASAPLDAADKKLLETLSEQKKIFAINKSDLPKRLDSAELKKYTGNFSVVEISCTNGSGTKSLENEILRFIMKGEFEIPQEGIMGSPRQNNLLKKVCEDLENASKGCVEKLSPELIVVDIRSALGHLGEIVGEVVTDDVLEALFSHFCVGK